MTNTPRRPITIDDQLDILQTVDEVTLSPDGQVALFVAGRRYDEKDKRAPKTIMAVPVAGGAARPFSAGTAVDGMPRWSPDGATVAFVSDRPHDLPAEAHAAATQVYLLPRDGGEARRLTAVGGELHDLAWAPDGSHVVLLMTEPQPDEDRKRDEESGGAIDVEERPLFWRLWAADLQNGTVTPLTPEGVQVWEFDLSPDGHTAAVVASDLPYEWSWFDARLALAVLDGSALRTLYTSNRQLAHPRFSPHGAAVAVLSCTWSDRGNYGGDILLVPADGGDARNLTEAQPFSAFWIAWEPDGRALLASGYEEGEGALRRVDVDGGTGTLWRAQVAIAGSQRSFSRVGDTVAMSRMDSTSPPDVWIARLEGASLADWRRLTRLHPQTKEWALGPTHTLRWTAPDGTTIQGLLALPPGYREGARLPLVVIVHGGPADVHAYSFAKWWTPLLAARGMAVLLPNPRGSTGWGTAFTEANLGDMGGADFGDIMVGVDYVVACGVADPDRLGIGGWSYGGFMSAWAVTQTDRFKAAVMGAGIADWRSFHGVTNIPTWDALFYGAPGRPADPYDLSGPYVRFSPLTHIDRARTPTLILHGERDDCVPVGQGYQFLRALRDRGVPARLRIYPRAKHGPNERAHERDTARQAVDWFARYLTPGV